MYKNLYLKAGCNRRLGSGFDMFCDYSLMGNAIGAFSNDVRDVRILWLIESVNLFCDHKSSHGRFL